MNISNLSFNSTLRIFKIAGLLSVAMAGQAVAQQATVSISSGSAVSGGSVSLNLSLASSAGALPAAVQWTISYPSSIVTSVSVLAGQNATAAGKSVSCSSVAGSTTCVVFGLNTNIISDGVLATATFLIAPSAPSSSVPIQIAAVSAADAPGNAIPGSGQSGTITVTQPQPALSGLSCTPVTVNAPGTAACTVTLSFAAPSAFSVTLGSNNSSVTIPAAVTVPAAASSVPFTATVAAVASAQTAILTATAAGNTQTFTLNIGASLWSISGTITPSSLGSGATVTLSGAASATVTADASGNYTFSGRANGAYVVTPSKAGYSFTPPSLAVTVSGANQTALNFTAQQVQTMWTISGSISPAASGSGAIVNLTGASTATATADSSGNYTFTGLANGAYTVAPSKAGYTFTPASLAVTVSGANQTGINFTAQAQTWTISGTISPAASGTGAIVNLTGASTATATADSSGNYTFSGLTNGAYTVTPNKAAYSFTPASLAVTVSGASQTAMNFTAQAQTWTISGTISPAASGTGAIVNLTGASTATATANSSGNYTFTGLANGAYTLTPSKAGYMFTPPSQSVTVSSANFAAPVFTATQSSTTAVIGIDAQARKDQSTRSSNIISPTFSTISSKELLLAFIATGYRSGTNTSVRSVSGAGLTWVRVVRTRSEKGTSEIWRAFSPSLLSSVSVTASLSESVTSSMTVMSFTGVDPSGTNGSGAIGAIGQGTALAGAPTAALTTTRNNSFIVGVGNDNKTAAARTPAPGQTLMHQYLDPAGNTYWVQTLSNAVPLSGAKATISDLAPVADPYNLSAAEILAAPAGPAPVTSFQGSAALSNLAGRSVTSACSPGGQVALIGIPSSLQAADLQVKVNGAPAPVLSSSASQLTFQCPMSPPGTLLNITLEGPSGLPVSAGASVMRQAAPELFLLGDTQAVVLLGATNEIAMPSNQQVAGKLVPGRPAQQGEFLTIYASGLGMFSGIRVVVGGIEIDPVFAGLAPGTVALYQVDFQLPQSTPTGPAVPLYLQVMLADGSVVESNEGTVAIQ